MSSLEKKPILFCLVGPAASGKSSIARGLMKLGLDLALSISSTSRKPRPNEKEAKDYFFLSRDEFLAQAKEGQFLEYAEFCGNFYGTSNSNLKKAVAEDRDLLLDIDLQGLQSLKKMPEIETVCIFVFPDSWSELEARLRERKTDSEEVIQNRLKEAVSEVEVLSKKTISDYFVSNRDLEDSIRNCASIVRAERLRIRRDLSSEVFE